MRRKHGLGQRPVRMRLSTAGVGGTTPDQVDGFAEAMFEVVDESVPYIVPRWATTDRLPPGPDDRGAWADLIPDHLTQDARGGLALTQGHGVVRARLGRTGVTRAQWESLPRAARLTVIEAVRAMLHAETAILSLVKHANPSVTLKARSFLENFAKIAREDHRGERGFRHEIVRTAAFRKGKRLVAQLLPELQRVHDEGERRRRPTFYAEAWCKRAAETVNGVVAERRDWPCTPRDIEDLGRSSPLAVAQLISSRVFDISKDLLRWDAYRSRAEPRRKARRAAEVKKSSVTKEEKKKKKGG